MWERKFLATFWIPTWLGCQAGQTPLARCTQPAHKHLWSLFYHHPMSLLWPVESTIFVMNTYVNVAFLRLLLSVVQLAKTDQHLEEELMFCAQANPLSQWGTYLPWINLLLHTSVWFTCDRLDVCLDVGDLLYGPQLLLSGERLGYLYWRPTWGWQGGCRYGFHCDHLWVFLPSWFDPEYFPINEFVKRRGGEEKEKERQERGRGERKRKEKDERGIKDKERKSQPATLTEWWLWAK